MPVYRSIEIYACVPMNNRYSIVKCLKYGAIGQTKAKYVDVMAEAQQLPIQLQPAVWSKYLKYKSRCGLSFKKINPGCNLVLRSILQRGSLC